MHIANLLLIALAMVFVSFAVPGDDEQTMAKPSVASVDVELIVPDQLNDNSPNRGL